MVFIGVNVPRREIRNNYFYDFGVGRTGLLLLPSLAREQRYFSVLVQPLLPCPTAACRVCNSLHSIAVLRVSRRQECAQLPLHVFCGWNCLDDVGG